jgi:hypothetical protein
MPRTRQEIWDEYVAAKKSRDAALAALQEGYETLIKPLIEPIAATFNEATDAILMNFREEEQRRSEEYNAAEGELS